MRRVLMVQGGWDGHQPKETTDLFAGFLRGRGFDVVVSDTRDAYLDEPLMASLDLIVHNWTDFMPPATGAWSERVRAAVARGVGLAGWHGGLCDAFRGDVVWQLMTGAQFVGHPNHGAPYDVVITDREHPLTAGVGSFTMRDTEQYYLLADPGSHVVAVTAFGDDPKEMGCQPGAIMPVAWTRRWGAGRVAYSAIGHSVKDFAVPQARRLVENALLWAARAEAGAGLAASAAR